MASGDPTLTDHGIYSISGAALKTAVDAITGVTLGHSGASLYFIPAGEGQINLLQVEIAA